MIKFTEFINFQFKGLGFESAYEFSSSMFNDSFSKPVLASSLIVGFVATMVEDFLGITPLAYFLFMILIMAEFYTGIRASYKNGRKIQSRKFGRMILKVAVYTLLIGGLFQFSEEIKIPEVFGFEMNIYKFIYYAVLNLIIIQLIISVLENLSDMGFAETNLLLKVLKKKLEKVVEFEIEEK